MVNQYEMAVHNEYVRHTHYVLMKLKSWTLHFRSVPFVLSNGTRTRRTQSSLARPLHWCHDERIGVSNHRRPHCLLNCWFRHRSKKTSKLRTTGFCACAVPGEFPPQRAINAEMFPFNDVIMKAGFQWCVTPTPHTTPNDDQSRLLHDIKLVHK